MNIFSNIGMKVDAQKKKGRKGFTLIESIVFLFIFALIATTFFQVYFVTVRTILESKNRLGATALANQRMEIIRSVEYDTIGTKTWNGSAWVYGIPAGELVEEEDISVNTTLYHVDTFVQYVDDSFDGVTPADTIPTDFKRIRITVSWGAQGTDQQVALFGNFSPNGVESPGGGGVLSINVLDASGSGVSGVSVRIQNAASSIDTTVTTDSTGNITLPGAPAGTENYILTITKGGYFGAVTYPAYPTSTYSPVDIHASVAAGVLNQKTIVIDQDVDILFRTEDPFGNNVATVDFDIEGGRVLGTDPATTLTVYNLNQTATTDSNGEEDFTNQSYGQYLFDITDTATHEFWKITPEGFSFTGYEALPGSSTEVKAIMLDKAISSLKATVVKSDDGLPIAGATVRLSNTTLGYDETVTVDTFGVAYFPINSTPLVADTYDIEIQASGFQTENDTVTIGSVLEKNTYDLVAN
jgi:type II secretory pathway pseudopilin PulG